ncbi:MAG: hypothetical protein IJ887_10095 [Prevotella sp.]|nr:hypothetical protein [Prevotella sp.]MBR6190273.1 hypothetical protein [Prevotella sp.]
MTALRMKQSSVNLINQIDDNNTALLEKVFLFLKVNVPEKKEKKEENLTPEQKRRLALVDELCGAFSACQTVDWKKDKEEYLIEKYGQ